MESHTKLIKIHTDTHTYIHKTQTTYMHVYINIAYADTDTHTQIISMRVAELHLMKLWF